MFYLLSSLSCFPILYYHATSWQFRQLCLPNHLFSLQLCLSWYLTNQLNFYFWLLKLVLLENLFCFSLICLSLFQDVLFFWKVSNPFFISSHLTVSFRLSVILGSWSTNFPGYVPWCVLTSLHGLQFLTCEFTLLCRHAVHTRLWKDPEESFSCASRHLKNFTNMSSVFILISLLGFYISNINKHKIKITYHTYVWHRLEISTSHRKHLFPSESHAGEICLFTPWKVQSFQVSSFFAEVSVPTRISQKSKAISSVSAPASKPRTHLLGTISRNSTLDHWDDSSCTSSSGSEIFLISSS